MKIKRVKGVFVQEKWILIERKKRKMSRNNLHLARHIATSNKSTIKFSSKSSKINKNSRIGWRSARRWWRRSHGRPIHYPSWINDHPRSRVAIHGNASQRILRKSDYSSMLCRPRQNRPPRTCIVLRWSNRGIVYLFRLHHWWEGSTNSPHLFSVP